MLAIPARRWPSLGSGAGSPILPFADDDPKTAEILAQVILLARDRQIKDPTILEQILPRGPAV